jgi:type II secretory pathway pseudopilin PulG
MKRSKQAGFSIVEAVLGVAVLGILGAAGWFVYQHNQPKPTDAAATTNQSANQQTTTTPAPTVAYLTINEWGVKLPLSDTIKDAYYVVAHFPHERLTVCGE